MTDKRKNKYGSGGLKRKPTASEEPVITTIAGTLGLSDWVINGSHKRTSFDDAPSRSETKVSGILTLFVARQRHSFLTPFRRPSFDDDDFDRVAHRRNCGAGNDSVPRRFVGGRRYDTRIVGVRQRYRLSTRGSCVMAPRPFRQFTRFACLKNEHLRRFHGVHPSAPSVGNRRPLRSLKPPLVGPSDDRRAKTVAAAVAGLHQDDVFSAVVREHDVQFGPLSDAYDLCRRLKRNRHTGRAIRMFSPLHPIECHEKYRSTEDDNDDSFPTRPKHHGNLCLA